MSHRALLLSDGKKDKTKTKEKNKGSDKDKNKEFSAKFIITINKLK